MTGTEFVALTDQGRRFSEEFVVRLGDADEVGMVRVDGLARMLQDVATDDWIDTGVDDEATWVVRETSLRCRDTQSWPRYMQRMTLTTWCGGVGAAWAERRTDFVVDGVTVIEAVGLWVQLDGSGRPVRIRESFFDVYGTSVRSRKVSGRVSESAAPDDASRRWWTLRRADVDMVGHVNNAALWQAVSEVVCAPVNEVTVTHHHAIEKHDCVELVSVPGAAWLIVGGEVRVSVSYDAPSSR